MTITTYLRLQTVTYRHKARSHEDRLVSLGIIGKGWGLRTEEGNKGKESSEGAERANVCGSRWAEWISAGSVSCRLVHEALSVNQPSTGAAPSLSPYDIPAAYLNGEQWH